MTPELLLQLVADGETLDVEFKGEERNEFRDDELVEAVVCLANRPGDLPGWLLVGVEDDGRITGARPRHGGRIDPLLIQSLVANRTLPPHPVRVTVVPVGEVSVIAIEVYASRSPVGTSMGLYKHRIIGGKGMPECRPFSYHEMQGEQTSRGVLDYSTLQVAGATWGDLDPLEFDRFRRSVRENPSRGDAALAELPDLELAKALGAVDANHSVNAVRVLGLLMFGTESAIRKHIPTHEAAFQQFSGLEVVVNDFFYLPLLRLMEELMSRFRARYREEEMMMGMLRHGIPEYPESVFREAVANALIHRDYSRLGATHVQWYEERIEISNAGGFPNGVRLDNLLVTPPRPRNPRLADAFKRAGVVERTGRGVDTIFMDQLRNGRPAPSYQQSTETDIKLVLYGGKANLAFVRLVVEERNLGRLLQLDELLILNSLWIERTISVPAASGLIQRSEADARAILGRLVESGLIEARGEGKNRVFHLSSATYRRLNAKSEYVRQHGFDRLQQEQMVLKYAESHGRVTRAEVMELCQMSKDEARYLLRRLMQQEKLQLVGQSRSAYYVVVP